MIVSGFAGADSALVVLLRWSPVQVWLQRFKLTLNNFICLMEKWVQIFTCIISNSSTKPLIPPLHKFTIQNLDCILTHLSIFGEDGEKFVTSESRIAFCRFFIVRVKDMLWIESPRGTSRMFFTFYTVVSPPICSY